MLQAEYLHYILVLIQKYNFWLSLIGELDVKRLFFNTYLAIVLLLCLINITKRVFSKNIHPGNLRLRCFILDIFLYTSFILFGVNLYEWLFGSVSDPGINSDLTNTLSQYIGTILAIFIPVVLPTFQKLVKETTPGVARLIFENLVFRKSIVLLALILLITVTQYTMPISQIVHILQVMYFVVATLVLLFLIAETARLLDTREIIKDYELKFTYILKKRWGLVTKKLEKPNDQIQAIAMIREKLSYEAKIPLESIFQTTKKGIIEDQVEVVLAGLDSIRKITKTYINIFEYSFQDRDKLLEYLIERFIDLKTAMHKSTHYAIMPTIVHVTRDIAVEALKIKSYQHQYNQSYLQLGLVNHLSSIAKSDYLLKETNSSAMDATIAVETIGVTAAKNKNMNIALACLDNLVSISTFCTRLNVDYANEVAKESNRAIINLHYELLNGKVHDVFIEKLAETIETVIQAYIDVGVDSPKKGNLSPIIGKSLDPLTMMDFTQIRQFSTLDVMSLNYFNESRVEQDVIFDYYLAVFSRLNQLVMRATDKKMYNLVGDIIDTTYGVCFTIFSFLWNGGIQDTNNTQEFLNEYIGHIFSNSVYGSISHENIHISDYVERWSSVIGLYLISFNTWEGLPTHFLEFITSTIDRNISKCYINHAGKVYVAHEYVNDLEVLYQYMVVVYVWEKSLLSNLNARRTLISKILSYRNSFERRNSYGNITWLPHSLLSLSRGGWMLMQPDCAFYSATLADFRVLLDINEAVERVLNEEFNRLSIEQRLINVLKGKVSAKSY